MLNFPGRLFALLALLLAVPPAVSAEDIVIFAAEIPHSSIHGWRLMPDATAARGASLVTDDAGWSAIATPAASPAQYVDVTFRAEAATPYTLWLRLQAEGNSKWNDSIWVQFSDALADGSPVYPIGGTSALLVNLATDSGAASLDGWGWENTAYWLTQHSTVTFATSGTHTLRIQVREDGVRFDQIVLSSGTFLNRRPGTVSGDTAIVSRPAPSYVLTSLAPRDFNNYTPPTGPTLNAAGATIVMLSGAASTRAYYASASETIDIGSLGTGVGNDTSAHALNDAGVVVGVSTQSGTPRAFVWSRESGIRDLAPGHPGLTMSASGINNRGDVVGSMCCVGLGDPSAFVHTGGNLYNLNTLDVANASGWTLVAASLINDDGIIVGRGIRNGQYAVFILTPVK
jgi:probable HAF family extracellular repeat protein